jgi:hypothetical protein
MILLMLFHNRDKMMIELEIILKEILLINPRKVKEVEIAVGVREVNKKI